MKNLEQYCAVCDRTLSDHEAIQFTAFCEDCHGTEQAKFMEAEWEAERRDRREINWDKPASPDMETFRKYKIEL